MSMFRRLAIGTAAAIGPMLFLSCALRPECGFNFIPFAIHQALFRDTLDESTFIHAFDVIIALLLFVLIRRLIMASLRHQ